MDPVTLFAIGGTACVKYLHDKGLDAAVGGFIGNRIDAGGCTLLRKFWNNTKSLWSKDELPRNADLLRVLKQAKLEAVNRLVKYTEVAAVELAKLDEANKPAKEEVKIFAAAFYNWYKEELKTIHEAVMFGLSLGLPPSI